NRGGVSNVDIDGNNTLQIKSIGGAISTVETLPSNLSRASPPGCLVNFRNAGVCSKDTGFIQPVHDGVRRGFVDGLRLGLHAPYPRPSGHGSALVSAPDRHSFASCDSVGCPAPPHSRWRAAACRQETSGPFPR